MKYVKTEKKTHRTKKTILINYVIRQNNYEIAFRLTDSQQNSETHVLVHTRSPYVCSFLCIIHSFNDICIHTHAPR